MSEIFATLGESGARIDPGVWYENVDFPVGPDTRFVPISGAWEQSVDDPDSTTEISDPAYPDAQYPDMISQ